MAKNLLNKYVWLVDTIYKAKQITFEEINSRWLDNDMSEGKPLALRTFHGVSPSKRCLVSSSRTSRVADTVIIFKM